VIVVDEDVEEKLCMSQAFVPGFGCWVGAPWIEWMRFGLVDVPPQRAC
jgi:hypothetical protein